MTDPSWRLHQLLREVDKSLRRGDFRRAALDIASAWGFGDRMTRDTHDCFVINIAAEQWLDRVLHLAELQNARRTQ